MICIIKDTFQIRFLCEKQQIRRTDLSHIFKSKIVSLKVHLINIFYKKATYKH